MVMFIEIIILYKKVQVHVKNSCLDTLNLTFCLTVTAICSAVTFKALLESLCGGSIYCLDCEFVPKLYCAYEERMLIGL